MQHTDGVQLPGWPDVFACSSLVSLRSFSSSSSLFSFTAVLVLAARTLTAAARIATTTTTTAESSRQQTNKPLTDETRAFLSRRRKFVCFCFSTRENDGRAHTELHSAFTNARLSRCTKNRERETHSAECERCTISSAFLRVLVLLRLGTQHETDREKDTLIPIDMETSFAKRRQCDSRVSFVGRCSSQSRR